MKLFGLKSCDTCKKALSALKTVGKEVEFVDVRAQGVAAQDLQRFYDTFGENLVNTRSTTWRNMTEAERSEEPVAMLLAHPTLMKRPVIEDNGTLYLAWGKDVQAALL